MHTRLARDPFYPDRQQAGRVLTAWVQTEVGADGVVVGLARGGVAVASEVASALGAELDVVAVRKVRHPFQPEYALGAVAPGDSVYVRASDGLTEAEVTAAVAEAQCAAERLDARLHERRPAADLHGRTVLLVDDGLATGATMIAAARWARAQDAERIVAAVPVAAQASARLVRAEVDAFVCPVELLYFGAVGLWYDRFEQLDDEDVIALLEAAAARREKLGIS
jgi:putative phosphoribosyl transferase